MQLTVKQLKAAEQGEAVRIEAGGKKYVLLSQSVYEDTLDLQSLDNQGDRLAR